MISRRQWLVASLSFIPAASLDRSRTFLAGADGGRHPLDPTKTFDTFRITEENAAAFRTCREVASGSARASSAVYLWGPPGTGKTHLLQAVASALRQSGGREVWYGPANEFKALLIEAIQSGRSRRFREKFRRCGTLLLDDIQLLREMERTTEELVEVLDWIRDGGGSIVIAGDVVPDEVTHCRRFADRLRRGQTVYVAPHPQGGSV